MSSGSTSTTGPGPALQRGVEGARDVLGQAVGVVHLADPLRHAERAGAEHLPVVDFLEGLAVALVAGHLADEQDHRRASPGRRCAAPTLALVAPGPRVTKQMPGRPLSLPCASAMKAGAAFLPAGDEADPVAVLVEAVEHRQVAFAGHAERGVDALRDQRLDQGSGRPGAERVDEFIRGDAKSRECAADPAKAPTRLSCHGYRQLHHSVNYLRDAAPSADASSRAPRDADRSQRDILRAAMRRVRRARASAARAWMRIAERAGGQQAADLLLLRAQGKPVPRGARAALRGHPRRRAAAQPDEGRADRGDPPAGRVHLELLRRAPGVPDPAEQREPAPRASPEALEARSAR